MSANLPQSSPREGLTFAKLWRFLSLPFCPEDLKTWFAVNRFEDISIDLLRKEGIEGVLLDVDGTLCPHHAREFSASVTQHVMAMKSNGLKVAIFTNAMDDRFEVFPGVKVVTEVPAKPDSAGFKKAMTDFLEIKNPDKVCMIGDNYLTDGGAISVGMRFIHVQPIDGNETLIHSATRSFGLFCARLHTPEIFRTVGPR